MQKQIIPHLMTLMLLGCLLIRASAQEGIGIEPHSFTKAFQQKYGARAPAVQELSSPDLNPILAEDARFGWPRVAVEIPVSFDINHSGEWLTLPNGDRLWRLRLRAKGAKSLMLSYAEFYLPAESRLHIYNKDKKQVLGAFSSFNNPDGGRFATAITEGEELTLEYYEPSFCRGKARLVIDAVGYVYHSTVTERSGGPDSLYINCWPGDNWQKEKRGVLVVLMRFKNYNGVFWGNGALMNNTAADTTPYVMTSYDFMLGPMHAFGVQPQFEKFVFYFNWEYDNCEGTILSTDRATMVGCTPVVRHQATNTLLLRINNDIPPAPHNPYFLGWDNSDLIPANPVCIYVPTNGFKRLALFNSPFTIPQGQVQSPVDTGIFYPGNLFIKSQWNDMIHNASPGAPLLNQAGRATGIHFNTGGGCNGIDVLFSRFHKSWSGQLSPALDPHGSGETAIDGLDGGCGNFNGPVAELDRAVLGNLSKFISKELHGNYKTMERAYIRHRREIDRALTSDDPKYREVRAALETLKQRMAQTFFRAFVFEKENALPAEDLAVWKHFLLELGKAVGSDAFTKDMQTVSRLFDAAAGKDLKSGLIAFDRAPFTETSAVDMPASPEQMQTTLLGNPGIVTTLHYELPYAGNIEITLIDASGALRRTLRSGFAESGGYTLGIDKQELPPGVYFVRCVLNGATGRQQCVQKMMVQ